MKTSIKVLSLVLLTSLLLSGCKFGVKSEKDAFVEATVKASCLVFQAENPFDEKVNADAKNIYKDLGFDVEDEAKMQEIAAKYSDPEGKTGADLDLVNEVKQAIMDGIQEECGTALPDGIFDEIPSPDLEEPATEEPMDEEETPAE